MQTMRQHIDRWSHAALILGLITLITGCGAHHVAVTQHMKPNSISHSQPAQLPLLLPLEGTNPVSTLIVERGHGSRNLPVLVAHNAQLMVEVGCTGGGVLQIKPLTTVGPCTGSGLFTNAYSGMNGRALHLLIARPQVVWEIRVAMSQSPAYPQ
ncbi:hypothetical protein [Sulfobacillus thermosulfidooxidans]|uniref:hypothetical protein n=1 Tax=Sulfobacillus thermosulfidooxidans TaxID=28034 RepID=UPI00048B8B63|nr:hypothetical protein [Sulfobacillus thermosulfidooxidans]